MRASGQRRRWWPVVLASPLALFGLAAMMLVGNGLWDDVRPSYFALVLGNRVEPDGTPSARLRARLERARELLRDDLVQGIVVSGGFGKEGHDEATVMRDYLVARGVPAEHIILDQRGVDTYASARNLVELFRQNESAIYAGTRSLAELIQHHGTIKDDGSRGTVIVVSQYFHVPRAKLALRRFGMRDVGGAHARFWEWRDLYSIPREVIGYGRYLFRRYPPPPAAPMPADTGG